MFDEMFPNMEINIKNIQSFNISIIFAMLFRNNNLYKLKNKLWELKIPNKTIDEIVFLLKLKNNLMDLNMIPTLQKERKRFKISDNIIKEFSNIFKLNNKYVKAFINFDPKIDAREIMKKGFKGKEIGMEKNRLEIEEFKTLLKRQWKRNS